MLPSGLPLRYHCATTALPLRRHCAATAPVGLYLCGFRFVDLEAECRRLEAKCRRRTAFCGMRSRLRAVAILASSVFVSRDGYDAEGIRHCSHRRKMRSRLRAVAILQQGCARTFARRPFCHALGSPWAAPSRLGPTGVMHPRLLAVAILPRGEISLRRSESAWASWGHSGSLCVAVGGCLLQVFSFFLLLKNSPGQSGSCPSESPTFTNLYGSPQLKRRRPQVSGSTCTGRDLIAYVVGGRVGMSRST